jgi:3-hydroxyacyl-[acyl-carrier-protein] dehydratase
MWHSMHNMKRALSGEVSATVEMTSDSPWFSGHFPGEPILPGIAQLAMVFDLIAGTSEEQLKVAGVSRVRFKKIVGPEDRLQISATPAEGDPGAYGFRMTVGQELVCSGILRVVKMDE